MSLYTYTILKTIIALTSFINMIACCLLGRFLSTTWFNRFRQLPHGIFVNVIVEVLKEVYYTFVPLELVGAAVQEKFDQKIQRLEFVGLCCLPFFETFHIF